MSNCLIKVENVVKSFPGVMALKGVDIEIFAGEVHALLGENGAGKSTLVKILSGVYTKDSGNVYYNGTLREFKNPKEAQDYGVGIIHQELNLCQHLTVSQNIFIGREKMSGVFVNETKQNAMAAELLASLGSPDIDPKAKVSSLSVSKQQIVEIAKALSLKTNVLIMDEPTSALTEKEIDDLFRIINRLKKQGVGIVYISHRMEELKHIVDKVSIFRDGEYIATKNFNNDDLEEYINLMVGRTLQEKFPYVKVSRGEKILEVKNVNRGKVLKDAGFDLYKGEILAFAGLAGAGRTELARAVFGADDTESMDVFKYGKKVKIRSTKDAIKYGIVYASEDRKRDGLVLGLSVGDNITLANLDTYASGGVINRKKDEAASDTMVQSLSIKTPSLAQKAKNLSGGNQQKLVVAKWLLRNPEIFIFDEPTRGIDVGAKLEIYNILNDLKKQGKAIIVISSELPEVLGISDRVLVMCGGRVKTILKAQDTTQEEIMSYATKFEQ